MRKRKNISSSVSHHLLLTITLFPFLVDRVWIQFLAEMLRSMVERDVLQYSTESRCWTYNLNAIRSEAVSNDVILLLRSKLRSLSKRIQRALMVSSTFGICMSKRIVERLSSTQKYADIEQELLEAVSSGYMESIDGSYRFTHDSVREASYSLINPDDREEYHFRVGMELLLVHSEDEDDDAILYPMADQLKHGVSSSSLIDSTDSRIRLAELFEKVGQKAMSSSDFSQASFYFDSSKSLLPEGHWVSHYRFSIRLYLSLGHASYSTGSLAVAEESWTSVIENGRILGTVCYLFGLVLFYHILLPRNPDQSSLCCSFQHLRGQTGRSLFYEHSLTL